MRSSLPCYLAIRCFQRLTSSTATPFSIGPLSAVGLAEARAKATECKRLCLQGEDPIEARETARSQAKLDKGKVFTFKQAAAAYVETHRASWGNAKHAAQWSSALKRYAEPVLADIPIQAVDTD